MVTYSHSRLSTYEQCTLRYKYAYIDKIKTEVSTTVEAFMGDMVHQSLEKLYKDLKFEKLNSLQDLLDFFDDLWVSNWSDDIIIVKEDYSQENYRELGKRMISDYYNKFVPFNQARTIGLETQNYLDLSDDYKIHVRIDRLASPKEGVYEIHDFKTNSNLKTQEELDQDRQLAIYALGVKSMYPDAKEIILVWHFLAFNKEMRSSRTDLELENLRCETIDLIKKIESETVFVPKPSGLCDYCQFKSICPEWSHLFEEDEIKKEEGSKLVDEYGELKKQEKELQKRIEDVNKKIMAYADKYDFKRVHGDKYSVLIWSKEAMKFPGKDDELRSKFKDALKALNLLEKYSDVSNWDLEKDFEYLNEIEKQVLSHFGNKQRISRLYVSDKK
ncbi:PD-(D/E)XK nuclease family protein [Candidatus Woesearchaeota archaeon]|nr:PD-(D/E)XK nuclease family protein [Candidatus Woesearchaeota archaeon]